MSRPLTRRDSLYIRRQALRIARVIEAVDDRAMEADGPVTPTKDEITTSEFRTIYRAACSLILRADRRRKP
jgi:hypothetical protein